MRVAPILLLVAAFFFSSFGYTQTKPGVIAGSVKDSRTKTPLVEAVVTVSSPSLQGQKFALTDSTGSYKIPNLPSGVYTVSFEMEGFRKYSQEKVLLNEGMSLGVSMEMARDRGSDAAKVKSKAAKDQETININ